jgi:dTDP-glucose 4,6-dehydratase
VAAVIERGRVGQTYHVGSGEEATIEQVADGVLAALGKPASLKAVVPDRPGHDRRYLLDSSRIRDELGWAPTTGWDRGLAETVAWYAERRDWWEPLVGRATVAETAWGASGAADPDRWLGGRSPNGGAGGGRAPDQEEMEHSQR